MSWGNQGSWDGKSGPIRDLDHARQLVTAKGQSLDVEKFPGIDLDQAMNDTVMGRSTPATQAVGKLYLDFYGAGGGQQQAAAPKTWQPTSQSKFWTDEAPETAAQPATPPAIPLVDLPIDQPVVSQLKPLPPMPANTTPAPAIADSVGGAVGELYNSSPRPMPAPAKSAAASIDELWGPPSAPAAAPAARPPSGNDTVSQGVSQAHADQQQATASQTRDVQAQQAAAATGGMAGPAPTPTPAAAGNWWSDLLGKYGRSLQEPQRGRSMGQRIDDMVSNQPTPEARAAAAQLAGPLKMGAGALGLAGTLAVPAAVVAPALMAGVGASDQYGDAGGIVAGAGTGVGALAGGLIGNEAGKFIPFGPGRGARMAASIGGALAGSGVGALVSGGANAAAQAAVDRANAGRGGIVSNVGRMLDAAGYQGTNDAIRSQMAAMEANPMVQLAKAQKRADEEKARNDMVQQIYLQALSRGIG